MNMAKAKFGATGTDATKLFFTALDKGATTESHAWYKKLKDRIWRICFQRAKEAGEKMDSSADPLYAKDFAEMVSAAATAQTLQTQLSSACSLYTHSFYDAVSTAAKAVRKKIYTRACFYTFRYLHVSTTFQPLGSEPGVRWLSRGCGAGFFAPVPVSVGRPLCRACVHGDGLHEFRRPLPPGFCRSAAVQDLQAQGHCLRGGLHSLPLLVPALGRLPHAGPPAQGVHRRRRPGVASQPLARARVPRHPLGRLHQGTRVVPDVQAGQADRSWGPRRWHQHVAAAHAPLLRVPSDGPEPTGRELVFRVLHGVDRTAAAGGDSPRRIALQQPAATLLGGWKPIAYGCTGMGPAAPSLSPLLEGGWGWTPGVVEAFVNDVYRIDSTRRARRSSSWAGACAGRCTPPWRASSCTTRRA